MAQVSDHHDLLERLNSTSGLREKLSLVHDAIREQFPWIDRIAIALYDEQTKMLRTFLHCSGTDDPLPHYEASLADAPSLMSLLETGQARVLNDLSVTEGGEHLHTQLMRKQGYGSSYTLPIYRNGIFEAFLFYNSYRKHVFTPRVLATLDLYGHVVGTLVVGEMQSLRILLAALRTLGQVIHLHDPETGSHLERMAYYARLIARDLAQRGIHPFSEETVEHIFAFAPFHDLGKIAIPDEVLRKPGRLDPEEQEIMRTHTTKGRQILDSLLSNFGLEEVEFTDILMAIAERHHEMLDGSGYPGGLRDGEVPIAARIVAVADIFDALTTRRVYKEAWSVDVALGHLQELAKEKVDRDCVDSLLANRDAVDRIRRNFPEAVQPGAS